MITHDWCSMYLDYWPNNRRLRDEEDAIRWESELRLFFGRSMPSDEELCRILQQMSLDSTQRYAPSLIDLRIAICKKRKAERGTIEGPAEKCAACKKGWIRHYHEPIIQEYTIQCFTDVPCLCSEGQNLLKLMKDIGPDDYEHFREVAKEAMDQLKEIQKIDAEWELNWRAAGCPSFETILAGKGLLVKA